ncbi:MAG TPA: hypothetical protein VG711_10500, partial [Phycisphaerales bacterium]|nr:hypothetical protein [Phycisphaerales bacterium]
MNPTQLAKPLIVALTCALAALTSPHPATAQSQSEQHESTEHRPGINVSFNGGTISQYIDTVRKSDPDANIVLLSKLDDVTLPPVKLLNVDVFTALKVLTWMPATSDDRPVSIDVGRENPEFTNQAPVFIIADHTKGPAAPPRERVVVISLKDLINDSLSADDILTAMESSAKLAGKDSAQPEIRFHKETGLVIARGTNEQIDAIQE